jgi:hypothetical protein
MPALLQSVPWPMIVAARGVIQHMPTSLWFQEKLSFTIFEAVLTNAGPHRGRPKTFWTRTWAVKAREKPADVTHSLSVAPDIHLQHSSDVKIRIVGRNFSCVCGLIGALHATLPGLSRPSYFLCALSQAPFAGIRQPRCHGLALQANVISIRFATCLGWHTIGNS